MKIGFVYFYILYCFGSGEIMISVMGILEGKEECRYNVVEIFSQVINLKV